MGGRTSWRQTNPKLEQEPAAETASDALLEALSEDEGESREFQRKSKDTGGCQRAGTSNTEKHEDTYV